MTLIPAVSPLCTTFQAQQTTGKSNFPDRFVQHRCQPPSRWCGPVQLHRLLAILLPSDDDDDSVKRPTRIRQSQKWLVLLSFQAVNGFPLKKVKKEEKPSRQSEITDNFRWFCFSFHFFFVAAPTADDFCVSFFGKISGKMAAARSFSWNYKGWPHGTLLLAYFVCFQLWVVGPTNTKNRGRFSRPYRFLSFGRSVGEKERNFGRSFSSKLFESNFGRFVLPRNGQIMQRK